ncbi:hypothetical protein [Streptomyces albipurpureus]|uniref:Uncharacterized protein n=1 Tax=Streptomyces albipurpureus TaxID=2897419 RepID=A0ABT0UJU5_9ACTN|nr:hypothetical protein [Streptomyces sp. CWNU-1]MCM2387551.1 hypothetical protein [Streptomyces sp. CWNU-1]
MNSKDDSRPLTLRVAMHPEAATPADVEELTLWIKRERVFRELIDQNALRFDSQARQPDAGDSRTPMGPLEDLLITLIVGPAVAYTANRLLEEAEASVRSWWTTRRAQRGDGPEEAPDVTRERDDE